MEGAAGGHIGEIGGRSGDLRQRLTPTVAAGNRRDQSRSIMVTRRRQHFGDRSGFDDAPGIHDGDAVGEAGNDGEIMGDPDQRRAVFGCQLLDFTEDLRLDGDIERRRRLIGDENGRLCRSAMRMATRWRMPPENW